MNPFFGLVGVGVEFIYEPQWKKIVFVLLLYCDLFRHDIFFRDECVVAIEVDDPLRKWVINKNLELLNGSSI